jgi:hypothetical protein
LKADEIVVHLQPSVAIAVVDGAHAGRVERVGDPGATRVREEGGCAGVRPLRPDDLDA